MNRAIHTEGLVIRGDGLVAVMSDSCGSMNCSLLGSSVLGIL